jgi:hypothetical protein
MSSLHQPFYTRLGQLACSSRRLSLSLNHTHAAFEIGQCQESRRSRSVRKSAIHATLVACMAHCRLGGPAWCLARLRDKPPSYPATASLCGP